MINQRLGRGTQCACGGLLLITTLTLACARGKQPRGPVFHGDVRDAAGDAVAVPDAATAPDLVGGIADVRDGNATFTIRFAPGAFDPSTTRVTIQLDTDRNASTGIRTAYGLGIEYTIDLWAATRRAVVLTAVPSGACTASSPCYVEAGTVPLTLLADGMRATVALSLLGHADGRLNFRVLSYAMRLGGASQLPTTVSDFMPDVALQPGRVL